MDKDGNVFFADPASNRIYKSDAARAVTVFKEQHRRRAGAARRRRRPPVRGAAGGRTPRVVRSGGDEKIVAQNIQANDLALTKSGAIYFVDTAQKTVGYIERRRDSAASVLRTRGEIMSPTALTLTPDQAMLLVGDGMDRYQWSFQIAADGSLVNGEPFQRLEMPEEGLFSGVGGLTVDTLGYMWATSAMGIQVCEQPGRCTNILNKPEFTATPVTSIAFGGPDRAWLYVTQGGKIFRRETKRTGVVAWEPVKPPQPGICEPRCTTCSTGYHGACLSLSRRFVLRGCLASCAVAIGITARAQDGAKTVADGVYTEAQADRGAAVYDARVRQLSSRRSRRRAAGPR